MPAVMRTDPTVGKLYIYSDRLLPLNHWNQVAKATKEQFCSSGAVDEVFRPTSVSIGLSAVLHVI